MNRFRTFVAALAAMLLVALAGCAGNAAGDTNGSLRFAWWGNDVRNQMTTQVINDFTQANADIKIQGEPTEWNAYWEKLATQVAGNDAPDIIQMDEQYLREYSQRGILADLSKIGVDTSKFSQGLVETGTVDGKVTAITIGVNALSIVANPEIFKAAGVDLPDDKTWTWDDLRDTAAKITKNSPKGTYGLGADLFRDSALRAYLFQNNKTLFNETGLGWEPADMQKWMEMMVEFGKAGAIPPADLNAEDIAKPMDQSLFGTGKLGMYLLWSNQINAMEKASGTDIKILRLPSIEGNAKAAKLWYKSGQYLSISSRSKNPEAAAKFLNYFVNDPAAGKVLLAERGQQPNTEIAKQIQSQLGTADQKAAKYLADLAADVGPAPVAPPPGVSSFQKMLDRHNQDVQFGRATPQAAAQALYEEAKAAIK